MSNNPLNSILEAFVSLRREVALISSQELKKHKIGRSQLIILGHLDRHGRSTPSDLAMATQSDPASTTRTIIALEKLGWIRRSQDPSDHRRSFVELTLKGRKRVPEVTEIREVINSKINKTVSAKEQTEIIRLLGKVIDQLQKKREA